jgi:5'-nucleotidase
VSRIFDNRRLVLLTNDDGIDAEGLQAARRNLSRIANVVVLAPRTEKSGASHSFSLRKPLEVIWRDAGTASVDGTPTDCVMLAVRGLLPRKPDLVVSGINHGPNLGDDVTYSGTVAAAMEGTLLGIPSIACSVTDWRRARFRSASKFLELLASQVLRRGVPRNTLLNVNVPNLPLQRIRGVRFTRLGKRIYRDVIVKRTDSRGRMFYSIEGDDPGWMREPGTDFAAIEEDMISITPFHLDLTHHAAVQKLKAWEGPLFRELRA